MGIKTVCVIIIVIFSECKPKGKNYRSKLCKLLVINKVGVRDAST